MRAIRKLQYELQPKEIDEISQMLDTILSGYPGITRKNRLRLRLSAEEILLYWLENTDAEQVELQIVDKGNKLDITMTLLGTTTVFDPLDTEERWGIGTVDNIMSQLGMGWMFQMAGGRNSVYITVIKKQPNKLLSIGLAMALAVLTAILMERFPTGASAWLEAHLLSPLFQSGTKFLTGIVGPMMLLAVVGGVLSAGSPRYLESMGRSVMAQYLRSILLVLLLAGVCAGLLFSTQVDLHTAGNLQSLEEFLQDIIPQDIVSPFIECNMMQIIFLGVIVGLAMLFMPKRVRVMGELVNEANDILCRILSAFEKLIPLYIYLGLVESLRTLEREELRQYLSLVGVIALFDLMILTVQLLIASSKLHISPGRLWKRLKKSVLAQLASASSAVNFAEAYDACEKDFGMDEKLAGFGLPFGTVIHKPLIAAEFAFVTVGLCSIYGSGINLGKLVVLMLASFLLSISYPPISGGEITCYAILLVQMGLPSEYLAIACTASSVLDFIEAPGNTLSTELQLLITAKRMHLVREEALDRVRSR